MDASQAIAEVTIVLEKNDESLYVFIPFDSEQRYFIDQIIIGAAATFLLSAFLRGVKEALDKRLSNWGKELTEWLLDRLEALFKREDTHMGEEEIEEYAEAVRKLMSNRPPTALEAELATSEAFIVELLKSQGVLPSNAQEIATAIRRAGSQLILSQGARDGT